MDIGDRVIWFSRIKSGHIFQANKYPATVVKIGKVRIKIRLDDGKESWVERENLQKVAKPLSQEANER